MEEGLSERLLTHHVAGGWRAPLSERMRDVIGPAGAPVGRLVEADSRDIARVLAAAEAAGPALAAEPAAARAALAERFAQELAARAKTLAAARRMERVAGELLARPLPSLPLPGLPPGVLVLLGAVPAPPELVAALIAAALRQGRALILKPAPRAPVSALVLVEAVRAAQAPPGAVNLLQGGGAATGAALLSAPGVAAALLPGKPVARVPLLQAPVPVRPLAG